MHSPRFAHRPRFDERSRDHPVRTLTAGRAPRSYTWRCPQHLNQGAAPACTGFSIAHHRLARPIPGLARPADAVAIYQRAQQLDQWPGEDYEGSSVLAAAAAAKERGWISAYRWAFGEPDVAAAVSWVGPVVIGVEWFEGMVTPDRTGLIQPTGESLGGHATLVVGYNVKTRRYRIHNSWGASWGVGGDCYIAAEDLAQLLALRGEACVPIKGQPAS